MELYELKWIEAHWKYITDEVEKKDISEKEIEKEKENVSN